MNQHYITIQNVHAAKLPLVILLIKLGLKAAVTMPKWPHPGMSSTFEDFVKGKWVLVELKQDILKYRSINEDEKYVI
jgi:hypothetical protein